MLFPVLLLAAAAQQGSIQLDVPQNLPDHFQTSVRWQGEWVTLDLYRRSLRAEHFILENTAGPIEQIPESRTYFGTVLAPQGVMVAGGTGSPGQVELNGAPVAASLEPRGLMASILLPDHSIWRLKPDPNMGGGWHQLAPAAAAPLHLCGVGEEHGLPGADDVGARDLNGSAGSVGALGSNSNSGSSGRNTNTPPPSGGFEQWQPGSWKWTMRKSRIAFDATWDYWLREGQTVGGVTAGVEYQLAENDLVCSRDALVTYELTGIVIRQSPFYTGTTAGALLGEFGNEWDVNQGHIPRESAVALDGYQGDGIAGLAWVGTLGGGLAYAGLYWDSGYSPGIIAHEVGHNWGAGHIDCWPWGGSAMCGSWLLYGPGTTNIILSRASWLNLPEMPPYADAVRPYADPDWASADTQSDNTIDVLNNDYDANLQPIHVSAVDPITVANGAASVLPGSGPAGRDLVLYQPDRTRLGPYTDSFWYASADPDGNEHWTPVTVEVRERLLAGSWKLEEGSGDALMDSSGLGNDGVITKPVIYAERPDPSTIRSCYSTVGSPNVNLWDNDPSTEFSSSNQGVVSSNFTRDPADGTWLEFDFGASTTFHGLRHRDLDSSTQWIQTSVLWFSDDNQFDSSDTMVEIQHHSYGDFVEYGFGGASGRYVRWEVTAQYDPNSSNGALGGKEMAFLYDGQMAELPTPVVLQASNSKSGMEPANLVDRFVDSEFATPGQGVISSQLTTNPGDGTWIELDFEQQRTFKGAGFLDRSSIRNRLGMTRLWFSNSPTFSASDPSIDWHHGNQKFIQVIAFAPIQARYVRWEVVQKDPSSFQNDLGGAELSLYTDQGSGSGYQRVAGPYGDCLEITGRLQATSVDAAKLPVAASEPFSMNVFINPESGLGEGTMIAGFGDPTDGTGRFFQLIGGRLHVGGVDSGWTPPSNAWTMITVTFDGSRMKIFADGVRLGGWDTWFHATSSDLHLVPNASTYSSSYYRGLVDEFAVWNYALSKAQVTGLLSGGAAHGPIPFDTRTMVDNSPRLSWSAGRNNPLHDVYLSTDFYATRDATVGAAEYVGRIANDYLDLQNLTPKTWYYWRVDEVHGNGDTLPGKVWRFRTELPWTTTALEGFGDGNDGDHLDGLAGGTGFGGVWQVPSGNGYKVRSGGIGAYPANVPFSETDGYFERKAVNDLPMDGRRDFDATAMDIDLAGEGSFYYSFALRLNGNDDEITSMCGLRDSQTGQTLLAGVESGSWRISGAAGTADGFAASVNRTFFVVVRIDSSGLHDDVVWMKIYNSAFDAVHQSDLQLSGIGSGVNQWTLMSSAATSGNFNQLFLYAGGNRSFFSTSLAELDEIRVGRTWTDVTGL
jgi:hypothetical protein